MNGHQEEPPAELVQELTRLLAQDPSVWAGMREPVEQAFDQLAPTWEERLGPHHLDPLHAGLELLSEPRAALDLGTGTALGADAIARRWPGALVVGADISERMLRVARAKPRQRPVRFVRCDAAQLPFRPEAFDLVVCLNMFPFLAEVARVLARGGHLVVVYSDGPQTPVYLPPGELARHLDAAGLAPAGSGTAGRGEYRIARRAAHAG